MADDVDNDEQWLYGDQQDTNQEEKPKDPEPTEEKPEEPKENGNEEPSPSTQTSDDLKPPGVDDEIEKELEEPQRDNDADTEKEKDGEDADTGDAQQNGGSGGDGGSGGGGEGGEDEDLDEDDDDDSEDDVNVVIEDIKTTPSYTSLNIKRGGLLSSSTNVDKTKQQQQQAGKFNVEEFDQAGTINGVPATEYNLDSLEEKPWRKPGADITDYFNYGFNEDTWRAYCERQKRMRMTESGAGLAAQMGATPRGTVPILNDNSKYSGNFLGARKAGPPPGRRMTGSIDVIGGTAQRATPTPVGKVDQPKMNVIQVMTADRREYSRKPTGFPDLSVPPPNSFDDYQPEYGFNPEPDPYYGGYEPTQDSQWGPDGERRNWAPNNIKSLTSGTRSVNGPPPTTNQPNIHMVPPPITSNSNNTSGGQQQHSPRSPNRNGSKDRERESERGSSRGRERSERSERDRSRDRDRERSHRRKRSRSRSRRHKSRSRSPSHRSHRKKKGRRHDDSD